MSEVAALHGAIEQLVIMRSSPRGRSCGSSRCSDLAGMLPRRSAGARR